jgi:hypothetical protein
MAMFSLNGSYRHATTDDAILSSKENMRTMNATKRMNAAGMRYNQQRR